MDKFEDAMKGKIVAKPQLDGKYIPLLKVYDEVGNLRGEIKVSELLLLATNMARESMGVKPTKWAPKVD